MGGRVEEGGPLPPFALETGAKVAGRVVGIGRWGWGSAMGFKRNEKGLEQGWQPSRRVGQRSAGRRLLRGTHGSVKLTRGRWRNE